MYNGNSNLVGTNEVFEFTKEQLKEFTHCARDPIYFIEKYVKIVNIDHGLVNFQMYDFQKDIVRTATQNRFTICKLPRQVGKLLLDTELIPTPTGFVRMADLRVGSQVYGNDGKPCNVVFVSEQQQVDVYRITFDNGDVIECCKDHQWTVYDRLNQSIKQVNGKRVSYSHREVTDTIENLYKSHWYRDNARGVREYAYYIPNTEPVQYSQKELLIDPYLLGLWLGDGTNANRDLTCHVDHVAFYESQGVVFGQNRVNSEKRPSLFTAPILNFETTDIRTLGIERSTTGVKTKRIPSEYLFSSVDQRIALVQGLMDTDGFVEKNGVCCIQLTRKNQPLIEDVYTLLCSLGIKVFRKQFEDTDSERLQFTVGRDQFDVCRIPHKLNRQKLSLSRGRYVTSRTIQKIEPLNEKALGRCIQVDSPNHLYLCTPAYIPTHNTTTVGALLLWYALFNENFSIAILANKQAQAYEILDRITSAFEYLPKWLQQGVVEWNKGRVELANGSKIIASATSSSAIRGTAQNLIYLDEFAFIPSSLQEQFFNSVYPTISSGQTSKVVITSTPNGLNMFYKLWADSEQNKNEYKRVEVHWSDVPGRDEAWKEQTIKNTSAEQFRQEFECLDGSTEVEILRDGCIQKVAIKNIINKHDC